MNQTLQELSDTMSNLSIQPTVSGLSAQELAQENERLRQSISSFQHTFAAKVSTLRQILSCISVSPVDNPDAPSPIASADPPAQPQQINQLRDQLLASRAETMRLEKKVAQLTHQLTNEITQRKKQAVILEKYEQKWKELKEAARRQATPSPPPSAPSPPPSSFGHQHSRHP
eukprot:TRINITY_DN5367_c0_g1_i6.p1 TRINITY_DN5367_c0_g1~~TRINITY_DN5367_c0_g1_i6.p1  ORF type:complete len:172 (-),score=18.53 TRINITY_DN5367_c0_g1_i6:183-698(-)